MEIRHADLQIEVEDAEDGGVLLTIIDSARLSLSLPRKTATELLDAIDACMKCFASMFVRQVRQCFSAVWADGFPRCRHRFPVM